MYKDKYLKYKKKYLNLKYNGGALPNSTDLDMSPKALKRIRDEFSFSGIDSSEIELFDTNYQINYKGNNFNISFPKNYPFSPLEVNGLTPTNWSPALSIHMILDKLIDLKLKNTLIYCHNKPEFHFLMTTWNYMFGEEFIQSNKIYFDLVSNKNDPSNTFTGDTFTGDGFSDEFLSKNNNLWDFIMVPDCGGKLYNLTKGSESKLEDANDALELLKKMLLNLKINGKLWLTKTITSELLNLLELDLELAKDYNIQYTEEIKDLGYIITEDRSEESDGVLITRLN